MYTVNKYVKVKDLAEAYELNQKKLNAVIGGTLWLRLGQRTIQTAIDLSGLGLDEIEETDNEFKLGCMVSLRAMETNQRLNEYTDGAAREAVRHIVGTQFRNCATLGGSIYGRFGFSDVLTLLLALEADVVLYKRGRITLQEFAAMKPDNDILTHIIISKKSVGCAYCSLRGSATDFPLLACAVSKTDDGFSVAIGARPGRAQLYKAPLSESSSLAELTQQHIKCGSNLRAGRQYREAMIAVLVNRCLTMLEGRKG